MYGVNYEEYDGSYDAKTTCYLVTDPGCTEDLDPSGEQNLDPFWIANLRMKNPNRNKQILCAL